MGRLLVVNLKLSVPCRTLKLVRSLKLQSQKVPVVIWVGLGDKFIYFLNQTTGDYHGRRLKYRQGLY